ncbi:glycosyl hydrolase [Brachybacterium sacelli]|uniref:Glycoside hydrolase n=1 Tax=Brachybacterium sacelli TaxID=173364 RepID=A0ABS4WWF1_9MICO|nr:glycosyl hydrolase [Brachybacterium sacelli]MBP2380411.1 hypothetical protein [Brachybacterium sacelli]
MTANSTGTASVASAREAFLRPDPSARPMMRWWWFGPDVESAEIDRELRAMADAGLGGAEVAFVYPLAEGADEFLSARMLSPLRHAAETARDLGLRFDVTLGSGWSYGGSHIGPEHASRSLHWERRDISPAALEVPVTTPWPGDELVAAYLGDGSPPSGWAHLPTEGGTLRIPAGRGPRTVLLAWSRVTGQQVKRASAGAEGPVLDHLSAEATRHHLEVVGESLLEAVPADLLGSVFCDSLEVYGANWTPRFAEEFACRRGYDVLPLLYRLRVDEPGSARLRQDVGRTLTELVEENFVAVCRQWAHEHGVALRIQAYGEPPVTLSSQRLADLIEGEGWGWNGLPQTRWASSAAQLHGREVVSSEIWTWVHSPSFRATPLDLKGEAHEHLLLGITHFVGHGWPYSPPDAPGLGWMFYAAGALDDRNPWWPAMPELSAYLTRLCWLLRHGEPVAEVKLYLPSADVRAEHGEGFDLWRACRDRIGPEIPAAIRRAGHDLQLVDDDALAVLAPQEAPVVVLPLVTELPEPARAWCDAVREAGGTVISLDSPAYRGTVAADAETFPAVLADARRPDAALEGDDGEVGVIHRRLADGDLYFMANTGAEQRTFRLTPRSGGGTVEQWDPRSGEIAPAARDGEALVLTLHPYEASVLVATDPASHEEPAPVREERLLGTRRLEGPWHFAAGPASPQRVSVPVSLPHRWEAELSEPCDEGTYETVVDLGPDPLTPGERFVLDLGPGRPLARSPHDPKSYRALLAPPVREIAVVTVDGRDAGVIWDAPHRIDLTDALHPGANTIRLLVRTTAAEQVAADPHLGDMVAAAHRAYGRRFDLQDLDLALDQVESGLHAVPVLHRFRHSG